METESDGLGRSLQGPGAGATARRRPGPTREACKMALVGKPGTGKTTVLRRTLRAALESGRRALMVTPHENERGCVPLVNPRFPERIRIYKGARRLPCRGEREVIENVVNNFRNGMLVFDDCRVHVESAADRLMRAMLLPCRQNDVDFFAVGHGPATVPPMFFTHATHFCIFATADNVRKRRDAALNFEAVGATVQEVNKRALSEPHFYRTIKNG